MRAPPLARSAHIRPNSGFWCSSFFQPTPARACFSRQRTQPRFETCPRRAQGASKNTIAFAGRTTSTRRSSRARATAPPIGDAVDQSRRKFEKSRMRAGRGSATAERKSRSRFLRPRSRIRTVHTVLKDFSKHRGGSQSLIAAPVGGPVNSATWLCGWCFEIERKATHPEPPAVYPCRS
jgi:hypothetical protein